MRWAPLLAAFALAGCDPNPHVQRPPAKYQGDRTVVAVLTSDPRAVCRSLGAVAEPGRRVVACEHGGALILLNPCVLPAGDGEWSDDGCHELGHANAWPADHPKD